MLGIFLLLGLGMAASIISVGGSDDDDAEDVVQEDADIPAQGPGQGPGQGPAQGAGPDLPDILSNGPDVVIAEEFRGDTTAAVDILVAEGEVSRAQGDLLLEFFDFRSGTFNIDSGGGDDVVIGGSGNDLIVTGAGEDVAAGGPGDDRVELGQNPDIYGIDSRSASRADDIEPFPDADADFVGEADLEGGNDVVLGGPGVDYIADGFGQNRILGQQGDDFIVTVDQDELSPDTVIGGAGDDVIIVDQGDTVTGGNGADRITVDVFEGVADGYRVVEISDFVPGQDILELEGNPADVGFREPTGPDDVAENPIAVRDLPNGLGAVVSVGGVDVAVVMGGQGLSAADIRIST